MKKREYYILLGVLMASSCVYPYEASVLDHAESILVVDGDIIVNGLTHVRLSRTSPLNVLQPPAVSGAQVYIEDEQGGRYPVPETSPGQYEAETSHLDLRQRYRLHLSLENQKEYASAYVPVVESPPIDSVGYVLNSDATAIAIHVSTHDNQGQTRYYKWSYEETWEVTAPLFSTHLFDTDKLGNRFREAEEGLFYCWTSQKFSGIILGNTAKLSEDVVDKQVVLNIAERDPRVADFYCIQITQMGLTLEAYIYWDNLRKNSENMGGIFSPMPSEVIGNISCIDQPDEPVLGYISAGTKTVSERKFIQGGLMNRILYTCTCEEDIKPLSLNDIISPFEYMKQSWMPIRRGDGETGSLIFWHQVQCGDCRIWGGTKERPAWWPNDHI